MKRKLFFTLIALLVAITSAQADGTLIDGLYYNLYPITQTAEVTYYNEWLSDNSSYVSGDITIPESVTYNGTAYSVTSIGESAFFDCSSLTSVTIPNSVTSIGESAFAGCSSLTSINIPDSVTSIGWGAFYGCTSLTSVTIPNSVTKIGRNAFYDVPNIVYSGYVTGAPWGARSMNGYVDGYLVYSDNTKTTLLACSAAATGDISIPNSVTNIRWNAFYECRGLTSVTIPESVTSIDNHVFFDCSSLTSVTIPNSVTSIGYEAFRGCSSLTSITIPNSVTSIGKSAFSGCSSLTSVNISESVTSIDDYTFYSCSSLTSVTIPNSVTSIGERAFYYCSGLQEMTVLASTPPTLSNNSFLGVSTDIPVYIPCESLSAYKSADGWHYFSNYVNNICQDDDNKGNGGEEAALWTLFVSSNNVEWGTVTGAGTYEDGTEVVIEAIPATGYRFLYWNDNNTANPRTVVMTEDAAYTAYFDRITQGTDDLSSDTFAHPCKVIENGNVYILLPDGRKLTLQGAEVR